MIQSSRAAFGSGARFTRDPFASIRRSVRPLLRVPLEQKLLGANLLILGVAVLLLFALVTYNDLRRLVASLIEKFG